MAVRVKLPRPSLAPKRVPVWAWELSYWIEHGRKGKRPHKAPAKVPAWFWLWRLYIAARKRGRGSRQWKRYLRKYRQIKHQHRFWVGLKIGNAAEWGAAHEPQIHYSELGIRGAFLKLVKYLLPMTTDCSGFVTFCYWVLGLPDPNGLGYGLLGFTGTLWDHAEKVGKTFAFGSADVQPADLIVMGYRPGEHVVIATDWAKAGHDVPVVSHGEEDGPRDQMLSVDSRTPKTVLRFLPDMPAPVAA